MRGFLKFTVVFLAISVASKALAVDRQAQARAAVSAARSLVNRANPYPAGSVEATQFTAQQVATAQSLGANTQAATGVRSAQVSSVRGATDAQGATTGALTQPLQVQKSDALPAQDTSYGKGQSSLLQEIAATQDTSQYTKDAIEAARQQTADVQKAYADNSQQMIMTMIQAQQKQIAISKKAEQDAAARTQVVEPKRITNRDLLKKSGRGSSGSGGGIMNAVPANMTDATQQIIGNLSDAANALKKDGRDNIANPHGL